MFEHLQIADARERWLVGTTDLLLAAASAPVRLLGRRARTTRPARILLLRLERIGDLLIAMPAIAAVRRLAPDARIDLVVGAWNEPIARAIDGVDHLETLNAPWLARGAEAARPTDLYRAALAWRRHRYDLAINFEGDVRSHVLMRLSGSPRRVGFAMAGGGPLLTHVQPHDPSRHVADNLLRLVELAFGEPAGSVPLVEPRLTVPREAQQRAAALLAHSGREDAGALLVCINAGGGREVKQWPPPRFGEVAARLAARCPVRFVFTGGEADRAVVSAALDHVPATADAIDLTGRADLITLAAVFARCALVITGDTGPMHLAAAVGAPVVALFGPSDARRWGPLQAGAAIVQADTPCRPCNRIRRPPDRCIGHVPECLDAVTVERVVHEAARLLTGPQPTGPRR